MHLVSAPFLHHLFLRLAVQQYQSFKPKILLQLRAELKDHPLHWRRQALAATVQLRVRLRRCARAHPWSPPTMVGHLRGTSTLPTRHWHGKSLRNS